MLAIKPAAALVVLGLGGLLGIQQHPSPDPAPTRGEAVSTPSAALSAPGTVALRDSVGAALLARVRHDLDDPQARLELGRFVVARPNLRTLEAHGEGTVAMVGSQAVPVRVQATYDLIDHRIDSVDYTVAEDKAATTPTPAPVREALARRIGARIAGEFPDQPARFSLVSVERVDYGRHRTQMSGTGLTDFGAEGRAYTPFVATLDKDTGALLDLHYELLQEDDEPAPAIAAR